MSRRPGAPYQDEMSDDGTKLFYEGHDTRRQAGVDPKAVDQPWAEINGRLTENAKFASAANDQDTPTFVRVYEKLRQGIWSDKGLFKLEGYTFARKPNENRKVFRFELELAGIEEGLVANPAAEVPFARIIPSAIKQEVYKRDGGKCVICGASDQLHFDHDFPFSKGGTSITPENVRILCARHNLSKGARIE